MNYPRETKNNLEREKQRQLQILKNNISNNDPWNPGFLSLEIPSIIKEFPSDIVFPEDLERLEITGSGQTLKNLPVFPNSLTFLSINDIKIPPLQEFSHIPLKKLEIVKVNIQSLPELPSTLEELYCWITNLEELPVLPASLKNLTVHGGKLTSIPDLPENLNLLRCSFNLIESLPSVPQNLLGLYCDNNKIISLPELEHTQLIEFKCNNNKITNIPKLPPSLKILTLSHNLCQELPDFPNSIKTVHCDNNNLKMIPKLPDSIEVFTANNNLCKTLPNIPNSVISFSFDNNPLIEPYASIYNTWKTTKKRIFSTEYPLGISYLRNELRKKTAIYEKRTQLSNLKNMANRNETGANWYYGPQPTAFSRLPENVQGLIAESITGKRGTLKQQNVQLAEEMSRPIIESSNGGGFKRKQRRKTLRKKRTSK